EGLCVPLLNWLRDHHPSVTVRLIEASSERLLAAMDFGQIDLAALHGSQFSPDLSARPLVIEDLCFVAAPGTMAGRRRRLIELERVQLALPPAGHLLRTLLDDAAAQYSVRLQPLWEVDSAAAALRLAECAGYGTVLPAFAAARAI